MIQKDIIIIGSGINSLVSAAIQGHWEKYPDS